MQASTKKRLVIATSLVALALLIALALRRGIESSAPGVVLEPHAQPRVPTGVHAKEMLQSSGKSDSDRSFAASPSAPAASNPADSSPVPALRAAYERESPDATTPVAEARIRAIYGRERDGETILRDVRCTRSVCKLELRWSPELNEPYNNALNDALKEFSRDIDLVPDVTLGGPEMPIPMTLHIARPGHSIESLLAERANAAF